MKQNLYGLNILSSLIHSTYSKSYTIIYDQFNEAIKIPQKWIEDIKHVEFFLSNPTSQKIDFSINNQNYQLDVGHCKIINLSNLDTIIIKSNCYYLRPIIFNYINKYIDVHHG